MQYLILTSAKDLQTFCCVVVAGIESLRRPTQGQQLAEMVLMADLLWRACALEFTIYQKRETNHRVIILVPKAHDPSGLRQESRALGATTSGMRHRCRLRETGWTEFGYFLCYFIMVAPRGQNSVISFVISKWLLSELSFSDRRSRGTKTLGTRLQSNIL